MALIIKNRAVVNDDWTVVRAPADGASPAAGALAAGRVLVPFSLWKEQKDALVASRSKDELGVWLAPDDEPADLVADFDKIALIAVDFPVFRDGRGFSIGRLLRERYQWTGELRAIGDVLRDQLFQMYRCGFNAYATRQDRNIHDALKGLTVFSETYQASVDNPLPLFRRHERGALPELSDVGAGI